MAMFVRMGIRTFLALLGQQCSSRLHSFQAVFFRSSIILVSFLCGCILTTWAVGWLVNSSQYHDPFSVYDAILPGNPTSTLNAYQCSLNESRTNGQVDVGAVSCSIFPTDNHFDIIHVEGLNNKISEVTFYATDLSLGQVLLHWNPTVRPKMNKTAIGWNSHQFWVDSYTLDGKDYSIEIYVADLHYQQPVRIIIVRDKVS